MRNLMFLLLLISFGSRSQELTLKKATKQRLNHGASAITTTNYSVLLCNCKKGSWNIDSIVSISAAQPVKFTLQEVIDPDDAIPYYKNLDSHSGLGKGHYQVSFSVTKNRGGGRPGAPQNQMADTTDIQGGVIIYYSFKKKPKQIKIESFEELEKIDAP